MSEDVETVVVEVTPLFYSRDAMTKAATFCHGDKGTIVFAWSRVELERGQAAEVRVNTTVKQNKVQLESRFVDTAGFKGMEKAGMIRITSAAVHSDVCGVCQRHKDNHVGKNGRKLTHDFEGQDYAKTTALTDDQFEAFWKQMPGRSVAGNITRGSKANAKRMFHKFIRNDEQYRDLLRAAAAYGAVANGYPKDAERFLRDNFWLDFVPAETSTPTGTSVAGKTDAEKQKIQDERERAITEVALQGEMK